MFGGKLEGGRGNVTDELWVFNVPSRTWQRRNPVVVQSAQAQIFAVEGHSAHCIQLEGGDTIMLVIFGYSPIYSYISSIQEYNLSEWQWNRWILESLTVQAQMYTSSVRRGGNYGWTSSLDLFIAYSLFSKPSWAWLCGGWDCWPVRKALVKAKLCSILLKQ